jgi:diphosphomevalonate decarboxylase
MNSSDHLFRKEVQTASAVAFSNIALIKYWGNRDDRLRLPSTGSISMNLDSLFARTSLTFVPGLDRDSLDLNGQPTSGPALARVQAFLDLVREMTGQPLYARVVSENNFPIGAGIASSAAAFAALSLAATHAFGLDLSEQELSRLARRGSGSACRSIPTGFVEWKAGDTDSDSYAFSLARPEDWDLVDCIAIVSSQSKGVGSSEGHVLAGSSPLQPARLAGTPQRLETCRRAILEHDFNTLTEVAELDSHLMHAVMMTSQPRLLYWAPASITVMQAVQSLRRDGLPAFYTLDAGPNVHVICPASSASQVESFLGTLPGVLQVLTAHPGGGARLA